MAKLRTRYSIQRLMIVVALVGLPFAVAPTSLSAAIFAGGIFIVWMIEGLALTEIAVLLSIAFVLAALSLPAVQTNCYRGPRPTASPPSAAPQTPPAAPPVPT